MVIVVILLNVLLSGVGFFVAWRLWKLRRVLRKASQVLLAAEQSTHRVLYKAPNAIQGAQTGTEQLRTRYGQLQLQLRQVQQILNLLSFAPALRRYGPRLGQNRGRGRPTRRPRTELD